MPVFVLSTWFPHPTINGSTLRAYHLLRALAAKREVDLAAFTPFGPPPPESVEHLRSFCRSVSVIAHSPFAVHHHERARLLSFVPRSLAASYSSSVRDQVREAADMADVAIGFQLGAARYLDALRRPTLFEEAEPAQIENLVRGASSATGRMRNRLTWWKHALFLRRLVRRLSAVTVVSEVERALLSRIGCEADKIRVIPNGVERSDLARRRTPTAARIVYSGSVTYQPNLDAVRWFLSDILPKIKAERADAELWVTGATAGVPIDDLPNRAWVRFTGELPDVKAVIGDAAVSVAPIRMGGGTRLKILEALALGTPVVSTRKGAEGLRVDDGEQLLLADTPAAFASCVLRLLNDEPLARRVSESGRRRVAEQYAWPVIGDALDEVVTEAIERWRRHEA
jgi:glycosyltransferase involved in cell wall biosynthesis